MVSKGTKERTKPRTIPPHLHKPQEFAKTTKRGRFREDEIKLHERSLSLSLKACEDGFRRQVDRWMFFPPPHKLPSIRSACVCVCACACVCGSEVVCDKTWQFMDDSDVVYGREKMKGKER